MTPPVESTLLNVPDSDVALIAVGFQQDAVIIDVVEDGKRVATMSLEQYITYDPHITADFIPGILTKVRSQPAFLLV